METIRIDARPGIRVLDEFRRQLAPKEVDLALSRSINRAISQGVTIGRRKIAAIFNIPQADLMQVIVISQATSRTLTGKILADPRPRKLTSFSPKFDTPTKSISTRRRRDRQNRRTDVSVVSRDRKRRRRGGGKGTSVEVYKGQREIIPYAFMVPNFVKVFARGVYSDKGFQLRSYRGNVDGKDLPISDLLSVSPYTAAVNREAMEEMKDKITDAYPVLLRRELEYRLQRANRNAQ